MHLFYTPDIENNIYSLNEEESSHCSRVLRLRNGDEIFLTNGKGDLFQSEITNIGSKHCTVNVIKTFPRYGKRNYNLHIAVAPTKNADRLEWFLEKATETGIDEITPLICKHSERKTVNIDRLNRVITAAMKQSLKAYHPIINKERKFEDFIAGKFPASKFIGYCGNNTSKLKDLYKPGESALILIGPEGDFSEDEIIKAKENNFIPINLGKNRYRTETAALLACHTVYMINE